MTAPAKSTGGVLRFGRGLLLHGNIRVLAFTSMMTGVYISMLGTILQPFVVENLGFSVTVLGALVAVGARPAGLASSVVQPFAGHLADLIGRRTLIVAGSFVAICSMVAFLLAAATHGFVPLSFGYFFLGLSLLGYPASQATIAESVAMDPAKLDVAFSVVFFFTQLPGAFIPFAAGYLVSSVGYLALFGAAALLESVNLVLFLTQLRETRNHRPGQDGANSRNGFSFREALKVPPSFARIFIPFAMDAFSYGLCGSIVYGMWTKRFGFTPADIGLIVGTLSVSILATQYFATKLLQRTGARTTLAISELLTVLILAGWLVTSSIPIYVILAVVFGASVAMWVPAVSSLIMRNAPVEERGSVSGKLAAYRGLAAVPAPIIGGLLFNAFGYYLPVALSMVGETVTIIAILKLIPARPRTPAPP